MTGFVKVGGWRSNTRFRAGKRPASWIIIFLVVAATSLLTAAPSARSNHVAEATYVGTHDGGGTVTFTVSPGGSGITTFGVTNLPGDTCTFNSLVESYSPPLPIRGSSHYFSRSALSGLSFTGSFPTPGAATGTVDAATGVSGCHSQVRAWSAVTPTVAATISGSFTWVTEGGESDTYTLVLTTQPTADVMVIVSGDGQVSGSPATLTFTPGNWNVPQTVTVSAVDDPVDEPSTHDGTLTHSATSTDPNYNGIAIAGLTATVFDNDFARVRNDSLSASVKEGGATDTFSLVLTTRPTADVTVTISPDAQVSRSPASLAFTPANWDTPQQVTVGAVDDSVDEPSPFHTGTITYSATSADPNYNGIAIDSMSVYITDNDAQCEDGADNDGDGKVDFPFDLGCTNSEDTDERDAPAPQCKDHADNDGDGRVDYPFDLGCTSFEDDDERDRVFLLQCGDGADNDGDGKVDFPADRGCGSAGDNDERDDVARSALVTLFGRTLQKPGKAISVGVSCPDGCTAAATGTLNVPGASAAKRFKLTKATAKIPGAGRVTLSLRVPRKAQAAVKRALSRGKKVKAKVTVTARDPAGNTSTLKRTIRLRR